MNKESIIQTVREWAGQKLITRDELVEAYDDGYDSKQDDSLHKSSSIAGILYYIGAAIIFLGLGIFVYQHWNSLNTFTKILASFGSGIAAYIVGVLLVQYEELDPIANASFLVSASITPVGLHIIFDLGGYDINSRIIQCVIYLILFATYLASYFNFKKIIFLLCSVIFGTPLLFSVTKLMMLDGYFGQEEFYEYLVLTIGLTYMFLGYAFCKDEKKVLTGSLYGFGSFFFLGAALFLGGWEPRQNIIWELAFPVLVMGIIVLSVYVKSKSFLTFGALYLIAYIFKISAEYFKNSIGWPLSLVMAGLAMMVISFSAFKIKRKYFT